MNNLLLTGAAKEAIYKEQIIIDYKGNPFIEALPDVMSEEEAAKLISFFPEFDVKERELPKHIRPHCTERLKSFVLPFSRHIELEQAISRMIRTGYIARNPLLIDYKRRLRESNMLKPENQLEGVRSTACCFALLGMSGIGKSTTIERILMTYPQVIQHRRTDMDITDQLVWLKLDCPADGSLKALCLHFFLALDNILGTNYYTKISSRNTTEELLAQLAHKATLHGLGIIVIDELQNLSQSKSGGAQVMLNFFVELINSIGLPVILVGTPKAASFLTRQLMQARRSTGQGDFVWNRLSFSDEWQLLMETLFQYQWTQTPVKLTQDLSKKYYDETQGIVDLVVKLHCIVQTRAINTGIEEITIDLVDAVAKDSFNTVRTMIEAIREKNLKKLLLYDDILIPWDFKEFSSEIELNNSITEKTNYTKETIYNWLINLLIEEGADMALAKYIANQALNNFKEVETEAMKEYAINLVKEIIKATNNEDCGKEKKSKPKSKLIETVKRSLSKDQDVVTALKKEGLIIGTDEIK